VPWPRAAASGRHNEANACGHGITIETTWEETTMPIPSLLNRIHNEALEEGREQGVINAAASQLRIRFGDDDRIPEIATRLAALGTDAGLRRIADAATLDDLAAEPR
jgi:hypothetical protein